MEIESIEIKLLKSSEVKDGDTILIKIDENKKKNLTQEDIRGLYESISKMIKKNISIYFFPDYLSVDIIKKHVMNIEETTKPELEKHKNEE